MELVIILVIALFVVFKLGLFAPVVHLTNVANRESQIYDYEHKARTAKRYENLTADVDAKKVNDAIKKLDSLNF